MFRFPFIARVLVGGAAAALVGLGAIATTALAANSPPAVGQKAAGQAAHGRADHRAGAKAIATAIFDGEADVLGMTPDQLRDALKRGQSIEDLAAARGMTKQQFADRLATQVTPALDRLVAEKKITQAQEDHVLKAIRAGHIPGWHRHDRHHGKAA